MRSFFGFRLIPSSAVRRRWRRCLSCLPFRLSCLLFGVNTHQTQRRELVANNFCGICTSDPRAPCSSDECIVLDVLAHFFRCFEKASLHISVLLRGERPTEGAEESISQIETLKRENTKHDLCFSCYASAVSAPTRSLYNLDDSMCFLASL